MITTTPSNALQAIVIAAAAMADDALKRILVVDDESTIRLALSLGLPSRR